MSLLDRRVSVRVARRAARRGMTPAPGYERLPGEARAAMIYLHSTDERQREITDALGDLAAGESA